LDELVVTAKEPSTHQAGNTALLRVAVIEDDAIMRRLLEKIIGKQTEFELCGAWGSGEEALAVLQGVRPDVLVVDLELPGISGEDCILALSAILPCTAFVVLTVHENADRVFGALQAGANGYLLKGSARTEIVSAIYAAHRGGSPLSPEIAGMVIRAFHGQSPKKATIRLPSLSPRERQILELLATGMVPKEAAAELQISYETVRDYLKQIYQKLHVRSRTEAVLRFLEADAG
jgi:DNA-binding NarL/FixJ family response regulator